MSDAYQQDIFLAQSAQLEVRNSIYVIAANWFVNRCPLVTRLPRQPVGSTTFSLINRKVRPRTTTLGAAITDTAGTTVTLTDASLFMNGDVICVGPLSSGERLEIVAAPNISANTVSVLRAADSTTAATATNGSTVTLIGNSRTGGEVNQSGLGLLPSPINQFCQTFQHPVQVSGSLQASTDFVTQAGARAPFDQYKMDALQNLMDDMEATSYFGNGADPASVARPKQKGLRSLLLAAGTAVTSPTNAGAYGPVDFVRDLLQGPRTNGGAPDVVFVASNFLTALTMWGQAVVRVNAGTNVFGVPIDVWEAPFLGGAQFVEAPLLPPYTAFSLTSDLVRMRMKRNEFWLPRGLRGDAYEGDWVAEGAIEPDQPQMHGWVEGITAFAATG